jgi:hypothetical protein
MSFAGVHANTSTPVSGAPAPDGTGHCPRRPRRVLSGHCPHRSCDACGSHRCRGSLDRRRRRRLSRAAVSGLSEHPAKVVWPKLPCRLGKSCARWARQHARRHAPGGVGSHRSNQPGDPDRHLSALPDATAANPSRLGRISPVALSTLRRGAGCSPSTCRSGPVCLRINASHSHVPQMSGIASAAT